MNFNSQELKSTLKHAESMKKLGFGKELSKMESVKDGESKLKKKKLSVVSKPKQSTTKMLVLKDTNIIES